MTARDDFRPHDGEPPEEGAPARADNPEMGEAQPKRPKKKPKRRIRLIEAAITVGLALALTLFLRTFVFQITTVQGPSMEGTLHSNERVAVLLFDYWLGEPKRGDVVLCSYPEHDELFIKRVLALPGEMVLIREGIVYVDGRPLTEKYVDWPAEDDFGPTMVAENCYFVLGDNRPVSGDSRLAAVGALPRQNIKGRAVVLNNLFSGRGDSGIR